MDKEIALRCRDCGALNEADALDCTECGLSLSDDPDGPTLALPWIDALPDWLRWLIALPVISIAGAVAARALLFAGIGGSPGLIFPFAVAIAILTAAVSAGRVAPVHGKYVGITVAAADAIAFITALLFEFYGASPPSELNVVLYATGGVAGVAAATLILSKGVIVGQSGSMPELFTDLGSRSNWSVAILRSLFPATALGAICALASILLPRYVPMGVSIDIGIVLIPAVTVTVFGEYAPTNNLLAARIVAGLFCVLGAASLITNIIAYAQFAPDIPKLIGLFGFSVMHGIVQSIGLICGATIGLDAASTSIGNELRRRAIEQVST